MTDKEKLDAIRLEIRRLVEVRNYSKEMANDLLTFINSLPEDPVSEDFKKFEEEYLEKEKDEILSIYDRHAGLVDGAQWQKQQGVTEEDGINYWNQRGLSIRTDKSLEELGFEEGDKVKITIVKEE